MKKFSYLLTGMFFGIIITISSNSYASSVNNKEVIKNANGTIIGYIESKRVYDKNRSTLGWSDGSGTYDRTGRKILMNDLPGILLEKEL